MQMENLRLEGLILKIHWINPVVLLVDIDIEDPKYHISYLNIMNEIADLFKTKVNRIQRNNSYIQITASSRIYLELVINYLNMYPLKSSNRLIGKNMKIDY